MNVYLLEELVALIYKEQTAEISTIHFFRLNIGNKEMKNLSAILKETYLPNLQTICLAANEIEDQGIEYLADIFINMPTLKEISLAANKIGDKGIQHLTTFVINMPTLLEIDLWRNNIKDAAIHRLNKILEFNKELIPEIKQNARNKYGPEWENLPEAERKPFINFEYAEYLNSQTKFKAALGLYATAMHNLQPYSTLKSKELKIQIKNAMMITASQIPEERSTFPFYVKHCLDTEFNIKALSKEVENNCSINCKPEIIEIIFDYLPFCDQPQFAGCESKITSTADDILG